ncbi:MAG: LacI family transcriptional regulator [Oscillospiraceae bacterium]|nr:LacI family transcriptional regulator [Oscillospiraceae bacterium]
MATTIKDVAQYTGLSIATISKYINGGNVLEDNRKRIGEAIEVLDYKVNYAARSLKTNKTMTVGILLPSLFTPFFSLICAYIEPLLKSHGYSMIVCSYHDDPIEEISKLKFLQALSIDGIVAVPTTVTADELTALKIPVVLMDRNVPGLDSVVTDNINAVHDVVEELIIHGHRRIGIILGPPTVTTAYERKLGYERAFADYNLPIDESLIRIGEYDIATGYREMIELLNMKPLPTAVVVSSHDITVGAIMAAYERKLKIPDDIYFVGYDEEQITKVFNAPVTTVLQPLVEIAQSVTELLVKRMNGDYSGYPQLNRLKTTLLRHQPISKIE